MSNRNTKEFSFRFEDLTIDRKLLEATLGFEGDLPEPFDAYLDEAWQFSATLTDIGAAFTILDDLRMADNKTTIIVGGDIDFNIGGMIRREIRNSERIAFFICTAGETISTKSKALMKGENISLGYVYDVMGSFIAEAAGDKMQEILSKEVAIHGEKITNRYSPGYCQWPVDNQPQLFSLFSGKTCGVSLTPSALMHPIKSISGLIGIGKNVQFRDYLCELCSSKDCIYRTVRRNVKV